MMEKEKPDCAYIATTPSFHFELTMLCLRHRIPVLCEKAMFLNSHDAKEAFSLSEQQNVFCMEALWSRFLPAVNKVKSWKLLPILPGVDRSPIFIFPIDSEKNYRCRNGL